MNTTKELPAQTAEHEHGAPKPAIVQVEGDDLEMIEEQILQQRLEGREAVESLLYIIPPRGNRLQPIIGPGVDFVRQLVRHMNKASKGKLKLRRANEPPAITDFSLPDKNGVLRPWVRVIVKVEDGADDDEPSFGIKELPRGDDSGTLNKHAVLIAAQTAERAAFENHRNYNRKLVSKRIRTVLEENDIDPKGMIIAGESGRSEWSKYFAQAKSAGKTPEQLRAAVAAQGPRLSEVRTTTEAAAAATVLSQETQEHQMPASVHEQEPTAAAGGGGGPSDSTAATAVPPTAGREDPGQGARGPSTTAPGGSPPKGPAAAPAAVPEPYPTQPDDEAIANLRNLCQEFITQGVVNPATSDRIWKMLRPSGDITQSSVVRLRLLRFSRALYGMSIGEDEPTTIKAALDQYPDDLEVPGATSRVE